jgi:hypothetical protein
MYFISKNMPAVLIIFLHLIANSILIARFAIPSSKGELNAGIFNTQIEQGETLSFVARYLFYTLLWIIPVYLIGHYQFNGSELLGFIIFGSTDFFTQGMQGILTMLLVIVCIFAPTLCCILATETDSIADVFSLSPISWLYHERRDDLGTYYSSIIGALFVFYAKYIIPMLFINYLAYKISESLGSIITSLIYILPVLITPILIGRLSGAFVSGESPIEEASPTSSLRSPSATISNHEESAKTTTNREPNIPTSAAEIKKEFEQLMTQLEQLNQVGLNQALERANKNQHNIYAQLQLCYLYKKLEQSTAAIQQTNTTLSKCINEGMSYEAIQLFKYFSKERAKLNLPPDQVQILAAHLGNHRSFLDAAWCYLLVISKLSDAEEILTVQKKLVSLATQAEEKGNLDVALTLYNLFIQRFPESTLVEFVKSSATALEAKVKKK